MKWCSYWLMVSLMGSRPARGAWIEIRVEIMQTESTGVAPRKGRVD